MKKTLNTLWNILLCIGEARAAAHFARTGDIKAAENLLR